MQHKNTILGWDIGGAHLKAVLVDADGRALQALQLPCALWQGMDKLHVAVSQVLAAIDHAPQTHIVTMTGELADIFADRESGVREIALAIGEHLGPSLNFYAGVGCVTLEAAPQHARSIASANWLASATWAATQVPNALFVDIGSTTADLVPIAHGQPSPRGHTDAERMQCEELVYTGVVRTSLMSLAPQLPFRGEWQPLAAEHFATMGDVYRLTGDLEPDDDMAATADGGGKSAEDSARRLARMIGHDLADGSMAAWKTLAQACKQQQIERLKRAVLRGFACVIPDAEMPLVGAGAGSFLVQELARQLGRPYLAATTMIPAVSGIVRRQAAVCLPAYAVAALHVSRTGRIAA